MSSLGKDFGLSPSLKEQGIVSILGSDIERSKSDASLRRTLSADMSSNKWLSQHGFFALKKIASSDGFQVSPITDSSSSEESYDHEDGRKEINNTDHHHHHPQPYGQQFDTWSSILSQKTAEDSKNLPPPYIHPLVKRSSASSLSKNSLEICTESLGSETGSDGFSSYPPSETGDTEEEDKQEEQQQQQEANLQQQEKAVQNNDMEDWRLAKIAAAISSKKSSPKSFPPPIPSLSSHDGASVHMRSRRDNGRLVLEVVSVPSQNNFLAQRQDGRLVLTFINKTKQEEQVQEELLEEPNNEEIKEGENEVDQFELELDNSQDEDEQDQEEDVEEELGGSGTDGDQLRFVVKKAANLPSGVTSFHRPVLDKFMLLANRNATWPKSLNKEVNFEEEEEAAEVKPITPLTQSLPPRPTVTQMITSPAQAVAATAKAAASLNAYEYYWKHKAMAKAPASVLNASIAQNPLSRRNNNEQEELLAWRGKNGDFLVPFLKGCKEPRRSLWLWDPHCIATS